MIFWRCLYCEIFDRLLIFESRHEKTNMTQNNTFAQILTQKSNRYKTFIKYDVKRACHAKQIQLNDVILCYVLQF